MDRLHDLDYVTLLKRFGLPLAALAVVVFYPWYVESLHDWPAIGDFVPSLNSVVIMIVFTMMAVGLNIVVGYAGLLDLGYVAFFYPSYVESLRDLPAIGDFVPSLGSVVIMIVFTMMAVGLNIVVGYAGLLDLGYVAFYAAGAYMAAWFASQQFDQWTFHFGSVGISK